jgi:nucleotide-binding universal stress UspA family protein
MHPFQNILAYAAPHDEAMLAVDQAAALARANQASLTVVRVLEDGVTWGRWRYSDDHPEELGALLEKAHREMLEGHLAKLLEEGLDVRVEILWGTPWLELVRAVMRDDHDLVVKAAAGAARGSGLFFGSTALHLIRKCPCPVWVVSGSGDADPARVLAAIDPSPGETRAALAGRVLNLGASMAGDSGELHVASAWRAQGESLLRSRMQAEEFAAYVRSARDEALAGLETLLSEEGRAPEPRHVHLLKGEPREVLPRVVEREAFDLVVMGSLGRTGIAGLLIGETAETLIRSVRCSVLVVKPPGFLSPVRPEAAPEGPSPAVNAAEVGP